MEKLLVSGERMEWGLHAKNFIKLIDSGTSENAPFSNELELSLISKLRRKVIPQSVLVEVSRRNVPMLKG